MDTRTITRRRTFRCAAAAVALTALVACGSGGSDSGDGAVKGSDTTAASGSKSSAAISMNSFCPSAAETQQRLQLKAPIDVQTLEVRDFAGDRASCQYLRAGMKKDQPAKIFHLAVTRAADADIAHRVFIAAAPSASTPVSGVGDEARKHNVRTRLVFRRGIYVVAIEEDLNIYTDLVQAENFTSFARDVLVPRLPAGPALSATAHDMDSPNPEPGTVVKGSPDLVSAKDGPIAGDGAADVLFNVKLKGQVIDLALYRCAGDSGQPVPGGAQWDTFTGTKPIDSGTAFSGQPGSATNQLGVFTSKGTKLNDATGALKDQYFSTPTAIQLVVADNGTITGGASFCIRQYRAGGAPVSATFAPVA
jgi:hypothetical protein